MAFTKYTLLSNIGNYGTARASSAIKYLIYHYTGNQTDKAVNNANYFKNNIVQASAHYFVDDTTIYQSVPDLTIAWAVGDNKYSDCAATGGGSMYGKITNTNSISIEMCSVNGAISEATIANAVALGKEIMAKYNIPISNVYRHFDVSGKHCPGWSGWYGNDSSKWTALKNRLMESSASSTNKYSVGQYITFSTSYPNPTSPCGITYATSGSGNGKITAIVSGQAKYQIDNGVRYCNDGDIRGIYTPQTSTTSTTPTPTIKNSLDVNVFYKVYAGGRWYSEVKNLDDYAGDAKNAIRGIAIKVDKGSIKYRIHVKGGSWYPYVTGYNTNDFNNGYAGDCKKDIDMVEVYYTTPNGYTCKKAKYRVAPIGKDYYSWQYDNEKTNGCDGYAGTAGVSFGKFQIIIE